MQQRPPRRSVPTFGQGPAHAAWWAGLTIGGVGLAMLASAVLLLLSRAQSQARPSQGGEAAMSLGQQALLITLFVSLLLGVLFVFSAILLAIWRRRYGASRPRDPSK